MKYADRGKQMEKLLRHSNLDTFEKSENIKLTKLINGQKYI